MLQLTETPRAVYIHIPFCTNKCHYCDFTSYVVDGQPVEEYLSALELEMARTVRDLPPGEVETIFVGGGTPTVLTPDQMRIFLGMVRRYFPGRSDRLEFTMEANPGTTEAEKLAVMREGGVNRISFGVQSFHNGLLERIGRIHDVDDVYRSLELARQAGFDNLSIDLMYGLPNQTLEQVEESVARALDLGLQHYSLYGLKVEENTLFHSLYRSGKLPLPDEDTEVRMYELILNRLKAAGYHHYEVSNFARPGYESRHNLTYWRNRSYYGLGVGAHGYVRGSRHVNLKGVREYLRAVAAGYPRSAQEPVSEREAMEDFMMVGLRMLDGVNRRDFHEQFGRTLDEVFGAEIARNVARGLMEACADGWRLTERGLYLGNEVFAEFV